MGIVQGMWLVALGFTGVASFRLRSSEKGGIVLGLGQLVMGGLACPLGAWETLSCLIDPSGIRRWPLLWCTMAAVGVVELMLGLSLVAGVALTLTRQSNEGTARTMLRRRLAIAQLVTGVLAIGLGVWAAVGEFLVAIVW